jgi:membrane protein YdbS with pleckstrin-like domain
VAGGSRRHASGCATRPFAGNAFAREYAGLALRRPSLPPMLACDAGDAASGHWRDIVAGDYPAAVSKHTTAAIPRYATAIDAWLVVATLAAIGFALAEAIVVFPTSPSAAFLSMTVVVLVAGFVGSLSYPCEYLLEADHLLIRAGFARWRIPYARITTVEPSRSPWAGPALSLRRVKIDYGRRFVLVSPRDREGFIEALRARVDAARPASP